MKIGEASLDRIEMLLDDCGLIAPDVKLVEARAWLVEQRADLAREKSTMDRRSMWLPEAVSISHEVSRSLVDDLARENAALHARVVELEAQLAEFRIKFPPFGGDVQGPVQALEPADLPIADVLGYLEEALPHDPGEFLDWLEAELLRGGEFVDPGTVPIVTARLRSVLPAYNSDDPAPFSKFLRFLGGWIHNWTGSADGVPVNRIREELAAAREGLKGEVNGADNG